MRAKSILSASALSCAILFSSLTLVARQQGNSPQTGDPVADAARRAPEAHQKPPQPPKVYTDDDVSKPKPTPAAPGDTPTTQEPAAAAAGTSANSSAPADQDAKTEAAWRQRFKEQREKISRAEKELDILQSENQKDEIQYHTATTNA